MAVDGYYHDYSNLNIYRPLEYERVCLPLCQVADTPFHIQGDELYDCIAMLDTETTVHNHSLKGQFYNILRAI